jgi:hypothetical protein
MTGAGVDHTDRHPATTGLLAHFQFGHLPPALQAISEPCARLANEMLAELPDGPELTTGLRKLLEAKDCFVRRQVEHLGELEGRQPANTPEPFLTGSAVTSDG